MDQYGEHDYPFQLEGIFSDDETKWDSDYEDASTKKMHQQAQQQVRTNANNPHYKQFNTIPINFRSI